MSFKASSSSFASYPAAQHARRTGDQASLSTDQDSTSTPRRPPSLASSTSRSARSFVSETASRSASRSGHEHVGSRFTSPNATSVSGGASLPSHKEAGSPEHDAQSYLPDDEVHDMMNHPDIVLAIDSTRFHAGDRKPVDPYWRPRWEMANFHVALWNALEQLYLHAPHVPPKNTEAFARYGSAVVHAIDTHHDVEEEYYFPSLEVAISMQQNLEQHASFDDGLRALKFYLKSCISDPTIFNCSTVLSIIDTFAIELATHFSDELDTLNPEVLREYFSIADLDKQGANLQKHVVKDYRRHLYTALPVVIVNTPPGREWPSLSPMYRRILLPMFLGRKYRTSWKYGKWPSALNVFGDRSNAAPSSFSLSANRSPASGSQTSSSFMHRAMSFSTAPSKPETIMSSSTIRAGSGLPPPGIETEAERLSRNVRTAMNRKASVRTESSEGSGGGLQSPSVLRAKKSLPPQPEEAGEHSS